MKLANESDNLNPKALDRIWEEEEMADWEDLDEFFKEGYRSRIRFLGEHLVQFDAVLGIRPIVPNAVATIRELYGPAREGPKLLKSVGYELYRKSY